MTSRWYWVLLLVVLAFGSSAFADNNCISFKCYNPPPYDCPYCGTSFYSGGSYCSSGVLGSYQFCQVGGSCDTGLPDCDGVIIRCADQNWSQWIRPRPLSAEWTLVRVSVGKRTKKAVKL